MPHYMLLLRDDRQAIRKLSPEEMQKAMEKYWTWRHNPFVVDGKRLLEDTGRVMQKKNGSVDISNGPYTESREVLGGYYTIAAKDFDEAIQLSLDHPHVDFGSIEIREVFARPDAAA